MDYSKYYLKNYVPERDRGAGNDNGDSEPIYEIPERGSYAPEIVYINPDGEEFTPEPTAKYVDVEKKRGKQSRLTSIVIDVMIAAVVVLTLIVSADLVTDGAVIGAITSLFDDSTRFYAVLEKPNDNVQDAISDAQQIRADGKAGYLIRYRDKYYCVSEIYDSREVAESAKGSSDALIYEFSYSPPDLPDEYSSLLDIPIKITSDLDGILSSLENGEIGSTAAIEQISEIRDELSAKSKTLDGSVGETSKESVAFRSDISVALAALDCLCEGVHPELAADIRYAKCQVLLAFAL